MLPQHHHDNVLVVVGDEGIEYSLSLLEAMGSDQQEVNFFFISSSALSRGIVTHLTIQYLGQLLKCSTMTKIH